MDESLQACEAALDRLINGTPNNPKHIGIEIQEITNSKVSVEAGFDKGFLKNSRSSHKSITDRIKSLKIDLGESKSPNNQKELDKMKKKVAKLEQKLKEANLVKDAVLTENIQLLQRVRELEGKTTSQNTVGDSHYIFEKINHNNNL